MMINLKRITVLLCTIFLIFAASCSKAKHRRLGDIKPIEQLTYPKVLATWGQPDRDGCSGLYCMVYKLEDGRELWLVFNYKEPPYQLLSAEIYAPGDTEGKTIFDVEPNEQVNK